MNYILPCLIPFIFLFSFLYAYRKKVNVYESFCEGVKGAIPLVVSIFPYLVAINMLIKLLEVSGLQAQIEQVLSPVFSFLGIPKEIAPLLLIKPLSGSGAIAVLSNVLNTYGVDSYISLCACVAYGSSETIFYIGALYFADTDKKRLSLALGISVLSYFLSIVFACFLCRFL